MYSRTDLMMSEMIFISGAAFYKQPSPPPPPSLFSNGIAALYSLCLCILCFEDIRTAQHSIIYLSTMTVRLHLLSLYHLGYNHMNIMPLPL